MSKKRKCCNLQNRIIQFYYNWKNISQGKDRTHYNDQSKKVNDIPIRYYMYDDSFEIII